MSPHGSRGLCRSLLLPLSDVSFPPMNALGSPVPAASELITDMIGLVLLSMPFGGLEIRTGSRGSSTSICETELSGCSEQITNLSSWLMCPRPSKPMWNISHGTVSSESSSRGSGTMPQYFSGGRLPWQLSLSRGFTAAASRTSRMCSFASASALLGSSGRINCVVFGSSASVFDDLFSPSRCSLSLARLSATTVAAAAATATGEADDRPSLMLVYPTSGWSSSATERGTGMASRSMVNDWMFTPSIQSGISVLSFTSPKTKGVSASASSLPMSNMGSWGTQPHETSSCVISTPALPKGALRSAISSGHTRWTWPFALFSTCFSCLSR
mmetsp:Transcript_74197/g.210065  ORF Transcript_74197/g.210065 Transcript_74197/m.210065 type:complete len:328 (+) Transcript_74197:103-1086(+)